MVSLVSKWLFLLVVSLAQIHSAVASVSNSTDEAANVEVLDFLNSLSFAKQVTHIVTGHMLCPPQISKPCNIQCNDKGKELLTFDKPKSESDRVRVESVELPKDKIEEFLRGIKDKEFDINPIFLSPENKVYRVSDYQKDKRRPKLFDSVWRSILEKLDTARSPEIIDGDAYNLILKDPIQIRTFISIRESGCRRRTVLLHFPNGLEGLVSEADRICIVLEKDRVTVKTMYPVLRLLTINPDELRAYLARAADSINKMVGS